MLSVLVTPIFQALPIADVIPCGINFVIPSGVFEARNLLSSSLLSPLATNHPSLLSILLPDWAALGACFALATAVFLFIFYINPDPSDLAPHRTKLDQLLERRDMIYDNLRDLKFEHRAGKYSQGDFELMQASLENEAALVLTEIEQVTESQIRRPRAVRPSTPSERSAR
jgi:hypothetical protein